MKKIVDLSFINYFPADNGGKQGIFYRLAALARHNKVYAFSINSESDTVEFGEKCLPFENIKFYILPARTKVRKHSSKFDLFGQFIHWYFSGLPRKSIKIFSTEVSTYITNKIIEISPDIIYLESIFVYKLIDWLKVDRNKIKVIHVAHNNEVKFFLASNRNWPLILLNIEKKRIYEQEKYISNIVDMNICISPDDAEYISRLTEKNNVKYLPSFLKVPIKQWHDTDSRYIIFTGTLSFLPNYNAIKWFLDNVFSNFINIHSDYTLKLTGKISKEVKSEFAKYKNIEFTGYLSDKELEDMMLNCAFAVVPIISGSGVNIKLLQAMSYGMPIVTTKHSYKGIGNICAKELNQPFLVGDTSAKFMECMCRLTDCNMRTFLGGSARRFFHKYYADEENLKEWLSI